MKKYIWMLVTSDEYELPLIVEDTVSKLAGKLGKKSSDICSAINKARKRGYKCKYVKVEINEEEENNEK